jgi:hypothetical protein
MKHSLYDLVIAFLLVVLVLLITYGIVALV